MYMSMVLPQFAPPTSPPTLPYVHKSIVYVCVFIPALQIGSSVAFILYLLFLMEES